MYIIRNSTGLSLSYWVSNDSSCVHTVPNAEETPLMVEPEWQKVFLPESGQSTHARTICIQFEGAWAPLTKVIVDKVGAPRLVQLQDPILCMYGYHRFVRLTWACLGWEVWISSGKPSASVWESFAGGYDC